MMDRATFGGWLSKKLVELNIDDEVFSPYIIGLLDSDDPEDEVKEGLTAFSYPRRLGGHREYHERDPFKVEQPRGSF